MNAQPVRQRRRDLHQRRRRGAPLPERGARSGMVGINVPIPVPVAVLLVRRLEAVAVRRHARARRRGRALLHPHQGGHHPLARPEPRRHQPRLPPERLIRLRRGLLCAAAARHPPRMPRPSRAWVEGSRHARESRHRPACHDLSTAPHGPVSTRRALSAARASAASTGSAGCRTGSPRPTARSTPVRSAATMPARSNAPSPQCGGG